jgi:FtsP/CotA-like multicopper oxidase with cupredoxin domain
MWGFAQDSAAGANDGTIVVPGPQLSVVEGDVLVVHVKNTLPEAVSIVIPGQYAAASQDPAFHTGGSFDGRVRSLTHETAPGGNSTYAWNGVQAGTFLYHSGTHPAVQVQMGLYGALTVVAPGAQAYAGAKYAFTGSATLLFSEIDPEVHDAVSASSFGPGPSFAPGDFTDASAAALIAQIKASADPVAVALAVALTPGGNNAAVFANDLNGYIGGPSIYDPALYPDSILAPATLALMSQNPPATQNNPTTPAPYNGDLVRMNRSLLYDGLKNAGITLPKVNKMTSTIRSYPQYFLVNGAPATSATAPVTVGAAGSPILVRLLNAGIDAHIPTLNNGGDLQLIGEDGQAAPYIRNSSVVFMPALKTVDALWTPATDGTYAIYDRRLGVANPSQSSSGMFAFLKVAPAGTVLGPTVIAGPGSRSVFVGDSATFSVVVSGTGPFTYQWLKGTTPVSGATGSSYSIPAVALGDAGQYSVLINGTVTSPKATLSILGLPSIATQPADKTVFETSTATFSVLATDPSGAGVFSYQWQKKPAVGGSFVNIPGATSPTLTLANVAFADNGTTYRVQIVDSVIGAGSKNLTSSAATLTVLKLPSITSAPVNVTKFEGHNATFTVAAVENNAVTGTLSYQWLTNGVPVADGGRFSGCSTKTLTITGVALTDTATQVSVVVTDTVLASISGSVTSSAATLTVLKLPSIVTNPANKAITETQSATFTATGKDNTGIGTLTYQWITNTVPAVNTAGRIAGATTTSLTVGPNTVVGDTGMQIALVVTDTVPGVDSASVTSTAATLTVTPIPPTITLPPANTTVNDFAFATFKVTATSALPLTYQWQKKPAIGGSFTNIPTAPNSATYSFQARLADTFSQYRVIVTTSSGGTTTSSAATLTVNGIAPTFTTGTQNLTWTSGQANTVTVNYSSSLASLPFTQFVWQKQNANGTWSTATGTGISWTPATGVAGANQVSTLSFTAAATANLNNAGTYRATFTSLLGTGTSANVVIGFAANTAPIIVTQPANTTVNAGSTASFSVLVGANPAATYQWQKLVGATWTNVSGASATTANLSLTGVTAATAGSYRVVATNSKGSATSSTAVLTVR